MNLENPTEREKVVDALSDKVWRDESRRSQLQSHGLNSKQEVKQHVEKTLDNSQTRAFNCQPKPDRGHPVLGEQFPRQVYDLRQKNDQTGKEYSTSIVLNPNENPNKPGQPYGGTLVITSKDEFSRLEKQELKATGIQPRIVVGGHSALVEQRQHQQLVDVKGSSKPAEAPSQAPPKVDPAHAREDVRGASQNAGQSAQPQKQDSAKPEKPAQVEPPKKKLEFYSDTHPKQGDKIKH